MRTLSSTLLAAQKEASGQPYVKVEVLDQIAGVARPPFQRLYTGSEGDYYHSATMPGDGSLVRARISPTDSKLYIQRVANPGTGSPFGSWTALDPVGNCSVALCSRGATVILFYVHTDGRTVYLRESANYGASFGSAQVVVTPAESAVNWLAAAINPSNVVALFYATTPFNLYVIKRTGGTWGGPSAWTNSVSSLTGLGCAYQGDWNLVLAGRDSNNDSLVWTTIYGDGSSQSAGTWSALKEVTRATANSNVDFHSPFLGYPDVFRAFFVEKYAGSQSYQRPIWTHSLASASFGQNLWREPVPFDFSCQYGLALAYSSTDLWLSHPSGVWKGPLPAAGLDITEDVLELSCKEEPWRGEARIALRNDDGRYNSPGTGNLAPLRKGSQVQISPGYATSAGVESSSGPVFWIVGWEHLSRPGASLFILYTANAWGLLDSWRARHQY
ncbi:MAG: hypothetical protein HY676_02075, partial [Chloroflexi bacterium]|nr:hypothetical protein [Chloroflexota bacterium]